VGKNKVGKRNIIVLFFVIASDMTLRISLYGDEHRTRILIMKQMLGRQLTLLATLLLGYIFISGASFAQSPGDNHHRQWTLAALNQNSSVPPEWNWFSVPLQIELVDGRVSLLPATGTNDYHDYDEKAAGEFKPIVGTITKALESGSVTAGIVRKPVPREWDWFSSPVGVSLGATRREAPVKTRLRDYQKLDNDWFARSDDELIVVDESPAWAAQQENADDKLEGFVEAKPLIENTETVSLSPVALVVSVSDDAEGSPIKDVASDSPAIAETASETVGAVQLHTGYVELRLRANGSSLRDSFFEVRMDQYENVYLPLAEMFHILELKQFSRNTVEKKVVGSIPGRDFEYLFDYESGKLKGESGVVVVGSDSYQINDEEIYLRSDIFEKWLPLSVKWNVQIYQISIRPAFELISQLAKKRKALRMLMEERKAEKQINIIRADPVVFSPGTIHYKVNARGDSDIFELSRTTVGYLGPLAYGDFSGELDIPAKKKAEMRYARLQYRNRYGMEEILLGDTSVRQPDLIGGSASIKGIRFASDESAWYGESELRGYVAPDSEVELYQGATLIDFQTAVNGEYKFTNLPLTGNKNRFTVVSYAPDGAVSKEEREVVSRRQQLATGDYLGRGEWGRNIRNNELTGASSLYYGLGRDITLGASVSSVETDKGGSDNYLGGSLLYKPAINTSLSIDAFSKPGSGGMAYKGSMFQTFANWELTLDHSSYEDIVTPARSRMWLSDTRRSAYLDYKNSLTARGRFGRKNLVLRLTTESFEQNRRHALDMTLYNSLGRRRMLTFDNKLSVDTSSEWTNRFGAQLRHSGFAKFDLKFRSDIYFDKAGLENYILATGISSKRRRLDSLICSLDISYNDRVRELMPVASVEYRFRRGVSLVARARKDYVGFEAEFRDVRDARPPFRAVEFDNRDRVDVTSRGWVEGVVFVDENADGRFDNGEQAMVGAEVKAGGRRQKTDNDGHFIIRGLSPYQETSVEIDRRSMDALYVPTRDYVLVEPGLCTGVVVEIPVVPASGLNGAISGLKVNGNGKNGNGSTGVRARDVQVNLKNMNGVVVKTVTPEHDGFYIIDTVLPGEYVLSLELPADSGVRVTPEIYQISIPSGVLPVWLNEKDFSLEKIEAEPEPLRISSLPPTNQG